MQDNQTPQPPQLQEKQLGDREEMTPKPQSIRPGYKGSGKLSN